MPLWWHLACHCAIFTSVSIGEKGFPQCGMQYCEEDPWPGQLAPPAVLGWVLVRAGLHAHSSDCCGLQRLYRHFEAWKNVPRITDTHARRSRWGSWGFDSSPVSFCWVLHLWSTKNNLWPFAMSKKTSWEMKKYTVKKLAIIRLLRNGVFPPLPLACFPSLTLGPWVRKASKSVFSLAWLVSHFLPLGD